VLSRLFACCSHSLRTPSSTRETVSDIKTSIRMSARMQADRKSGVSLRLVNLDGGILVMVSNILNSASYACLKKKTKYGE
jgi:hypothetical protein